MSNRKKMKPVKRRPVKPSLRGIYKTLQDLDDYEEKLRQEEMIEEVKNGHQ